MRRGDSIAARRSQPADPEVASAGSARPSPWRRTLMETVIALTRGSYPAEVRAPLTPALSRRERESSVEGGGDVRGGHGEAGHVADDREGDHAAVEEAVGFLRDVVRGHG